MVATKKKLWVHSCLQPLLQESKVALLYRILPCPTKGYVGLPLSLCLKTAKRLDMRVDHAIRDVARWVLGVEPGQARICV